MARRSSQTASERVSIAAASRSATSRRMPTPLLESHASDLSMRGICGDIRGCTSRDSRYISSTRSMRVVDTVPIGPALCYTSVRSSSCTARSLLPIHVPPMPVLAQQPKP